MMGPVNTDASGIVVVDDPESLRELWRQMKFACARRAPELSDDYLLGFSHAMRVVGHISERDFFEVCDFVAGRIQRRMETDLGTVRKLNSSH